jgi:hypothetical protein
MMPGRRGRTNIVARRPIARSAAAALYRDRTERHWSVYGRWLAWFSR